LTTALPVLTGHDLQNLFLVSFFVESLL